MRAIRYTPAVTIVAAWISALTGVGPSIASGSQVCSGICADFANAPTSSSTQPATRSPLFGPWPKAPVFDRVEAPQEVERVRCA